MALLGSLHLIADAGEYPRGPVPVGGEVFRCSFDGSGTAEVGAGIRKMALRYSRYQCNEGWKFSYVDGRFGKAVDVHPDRKVEYDSPRDRRVRPYEETAYKAHGQLCIRTGTISLWFRANKSGQPRVVVETQSNDQHAKPLLTFSATNGQPALTFLDRAYREIKGKGMAVDVNDNQWHHLAVVWDETSGVIAYLDGAVWAETRKTSIQAGYLSAARLGFMGCILDEARIFDVALSEAQVKSLMTGQLDTSDLTKFDLGSTHAHRLEHLGWDKASANHFIGVGTGKRATLVHRVNIAKARDIEQFGFRAVDGREDTVWPRRYHNYAYPDRKASLRLFLAEGEKFNRVQVRGWIDAAGLYPGDAYTRPADKRPLLELDGERFITNFTLDPPCTAPSVTMYAYNVLTTGPSVSNTYYWRMGKEMHGLTLMDVRDGGKPEDGVVFEGNVTGQAPETVAGENRIRLVNWYRPNERHVLMSSPGRQGRQPNASCRSVHNSPLPLVANPAENSTIVGNVGKEAREAARVTIDPLKYFHLMLPAQKHDLPLSAIRLALKTDGWKPGNTVNVRLHDPFNVWRTLADVDVQLTSADGMDLTLQFPPTLLPAGTELWVTMISRDGGTLRAGDGSSKLIAYGPDIETAKTAYNATQHRLLQEDFQVISEPHPWSYTTTHNRDLRIAAPYWENVARRMWDLHRRFPDDKWATGYVMWTHRGTYEFYPKLRDSLPAPFPERPDAPEWATLQWAVSLKHFEFIDYWIDERQVPNGELGNGSGDDTDLLGDWVSMALLSDRDDKIRRSQRLLNDYCWHQTMHNGLNKGFTDALHAYEAGNNMQPFAAVIDYGNPLLMEMLLTTARRYDGFLLSKAVDGKRTSRAGHFNTDRVDLDSRYGKPEHNRLILHAGQYLAFYCGHPKLTQMLAEYQRGTPKLGKGSQLEYVLYQVTGDRKWADAAANVYLDRGWPHLLELNRTEGATEALAWGARPERTYYHRWFYTQDKSWLVKALRLHWKNHYYMFDLLTRTGQSGDRVHLTWFGSKTLTDAMYFGGSPGARNELAQLNAVSYDGFTKNFAGLVVDDTTTQLRWIGFNFEKKPMTGKIRVWRLVPGEYEIRTGVDDNNDDRIDGTPDKVFRIGLKRYDPITVTLPVSKTYVVEAKLIRRDPVSLYDRADLAITHEDAVRQDGKLTVVVHNVGCKESGGFTVKVAEAAGRVLETRQHAGLKGIGDLKPKTATFTFEAIPDTAVVVTVVGPEKEITVVNNTATIASRSSAFHTR
jgi:hypothetical protein